MNTAVKQKKQLEVRTAFYEMNFARTPCAVNRAPSLSLPD